MEKGNISQKQQEILDFLKTSILQKGYPPSVRDICIAVNLKSTSSVHAHLETLEKNGYIECINASDENGATCGIKCRIKI